MVEIWWVKQNKERVREQNENKEESEKENQFKIGTSAI